MSDILEQVDVTLKQVDTTLQEVKQGLANVLEAVNVETVAEENVPNRVMVTDGTGNPTTSSITNTELGYLDNASGNIQAQLDNKLPKRSSYTNGVLITNGSGDIVTHSTVGVNELGMLDGTTSNLQAQLDTKQPKNIGVVNKVVITDGSGNITTYADIDSSHLKPLIGMTWDDLRGIAFVHYDSSGNLDSRLRFMVTAYGINLVGNQPIVIQSQSVTHSTAHSANSYYDSSLGKYYAFWGHTLNSTEMGAYGIEEACVWIGDSSLPLRLRGTEVTMNGVEVALKSGWAKSKALVSNANGAIAASNTTTTELHHLMGVTANVQTQLDGKLSISGNTPSRVMVSDADGNARASSLVTTDELSHLSGVTADIQTQLNTKQPKSLGTANRALVSNGSGEIGVSAVTASQLSMLKNVTSDVQTQINDKQSQITSISGKVAANTLIGEVKWLAFSESVAGWLLCDGRAVSRTDYAALFAAIGTAWGEGDGSTTFNLPNLIDKTVWGGVTAGSYKEAGLPNIEGELSNFVGTTQPTVSGALSISATGSTRFTNEATGDFATHRMRFDASSDIYGKSDTVQPPAAVLRPVIKY